MISYKLYSVAKINYINLYARNKEEAYDVAVYEKIPEIEKEMPYSAWVSKATCKNGIVKVFNTSEGNPY